MSTYLALCGSARQDSLNFKAVSTILGRLDDLGGTTTMVDLGQLGIPLYHGDLEASQGLPHGVVTLRRQLSEHQGLIIGCPEYNGFMTPLLLNAINWATRSAQATPELSPFKDRPTLICSASPGGFGGARAAQHLRTMLSGMGCLVIPDVFSVAGASHAFDEDGQLQDERLGNRADQIAQRFSEFTHRNH
ncbi:MAG: NAD(P)H-dependent oxidoreductase [Proteobacteria bacterium]|nr:NAD(P)H-dependent oxidoreductase [Pseudomonadota bacterium]